jgi:hypothetical protein
MADADFADTAPHTVGDVIDELEAARAAAKAGTATPRQKQLLEEEKAATRAIAPRMRELYQRMLKHPEAFEPKARPMIRRLRREFGGRRQRRTPRRASNCRSRGSRRVTSTSSSRGDPGDPDPPGSGEAGWGHTSRVLDDERRAVVA